MFLPSESGLESMRPDSAPSLRPDPGSRDSPALGTERDSSPDLSSSLSQSTEELNQDKVRQTNLPNPCVRMGPLLNHIDRKDTSPKEPC